MADETQLDQNAQRLDAALKAVNRRIASLIAGLDVSNGRFVSDSVNLQAALNMRVEIALAFAQYNNEAAAVLDSYKKAARDAAAEFAALGIAAEFTQADADLIDAMIRDVGAELDGLSLQAQSTISQDVYKAVIAGDSLSDLTDTIEQRLLGGTDKRGQPMANHAKTIAETRYMEVDSIITDRLAQEAGIDKFRYAGSLIKDSREWCKEHAGKVFTRSEIEGWRDQQWAGKKAGDPFTVRGGWNCRHYWIPVVD